MGLQVIGLLLVAVFAILAPFYGWFIMGAMNAMNETYFEVTAFADDGSANPLYNKDSDKTVLEEVFNPWIIYMMCGAVIIGCSKAIS